MLYHFTLSFSELIVCRAGITGILPLTTDPSQNYSVEIIVFIVGCVLAIGLERVYKSLFPSPLFD